MRLWWEVIREIGRTMEGIGWVLKSWAWDRIWYGSRGEGRKVNPDIAEMSNRKFRYYWWRRYE